MRAPLLVSLLAGFVGLTAAGCAGADEAAHFGPEAVPSARAVAALTDTLAEARSTTPRRAAIRRALVRAGVTPFGDGRLQARFQTDLGIPLVGGFIPGRHPLGRAELVVLGTRVDGGAVPAVIEAAHVLVQRSQYATVPERTVEVAFWPGGDGVRQVLRSSLWPRDQIRAFVVAGGEGPATVDGVPVIRLDVDAGGVDLAAALIEQTAEAARIPAPSSDTLATRSPR
ncbi:hypothetical protein [Rubrivirga marina]|uniref:Uncharacterized protein n=1 Tax=Rubrivirga marina TaxID=1196024 RepID=A0A271J489_9BACT|nr:hypothetical protein [Rubrivirga marina]PAP77509.1 hypothetical protein BSZ37_14205 [Rubrivirga marina]